MAYLGRQPNTGVRSRYIFTATASQTTFSGSDDDGKTLKYEDAAYLDVFLNGVLLKPVTDYTATTKTSVVLTSGAAVSDIVEIVAYDIANIADTVSKANGGTFEADVTVQGTVTADGLTVDTDTLYVDAANNRVGVGTTSPSANLDVASSNATIHLTDTDDTTYGEIRNNGGTFTIASDEGAAASASSINFRVDGSERARIDSSGNLLVGGNSLSNAYVSLRGGDNNCITTFRIGTGSRTHHAFYNGTSGSGSLVGSITTSGSSTSYNTSSDYRLKENVADLTGAIDRVKQVPVHRFNFIADPDKTVDGFLAHEVADVVPEAITGTKDEVDEEGNPVYQGIDQSKLVPLLTAAIKEQQALIEDLQTRLAALENA